MTYRDYPTGPWAMSWPDLTHKRLWWHYGPERALAISRGTDPQTQADLTAWRNLGQRSAA